MSGIAGFISPSDSPADREATLVRMGEAFADRGLLPIRVAKSGACTLGDRIASMSREAMSGATREGRLKAVVSGDLLNFDELRQELQAHGLEGSAVSQSMLVARAYAAWAGGCLRRLRGSFALAVWDRETDTLLLARDPLGQRTLYYVQHGERFLFATELRALASSAAFPLVIDPEAVNECVTYGAPIAPRTIYAGVQAVRPGECITFQGGAVSRRAYWTFRDIAPTNIPKRGASMDFLPEFRSRFAEVTRLHFAADVRLGCLISGDIGSTLVAGLAAKVSPTPLRTFSVCFADEGYRSDDYAPRIARHFGTRHESRLLGGADVARDLDAILASYDQPGDDVIGAFYLSQSAANAGLNALLTGAGAGPLFGQVEWFQHRTDDARPARWWQKWMHLLRRDEGPASRILGSLLKRGGSLHEVGSLQQRIVSENLRQRLLAAPGVFRPHAELEHLPREVPDRDLSLVGSAWDMRSRLACIEMPSVQRASAVHGVRVLHPLLDPTLLAWCRAHPADAAQASLVEAGGLTSALSDLLLPDTRIRPHATVEPPYSLWMRGTLRPFMEQSFSEASLSRSGFFQARPLRQLWEDALLDRPTDWRALWRLAVLVHFLNRRTRAEVPNLA